MSKSLNYLFKSGKITTLLDGSFGSSGKAKMASYIAEHSDNWTFACNTFAPQAGHTVVLDDNTVHFYQTLNSCAYLVDRYEKMYIGPGGMIELPALLREIEDNNIPQCKIGISPSVAILQAKDSAFERGEVDLDGNPYKSEGTIMKGSTTHGVGACGARKMLRRKDMLYAKDVPKLKHFICNVPAEIMDRLNRGESGFGEIAQGFPLSLNHQSFCGYTTSRNVTVSQFLSDMFLPPVVAGPVIINFRTYPIRINSNKYIGLDGKFLTWDDVKRGVPHTVIQGNSGPWYPDQKELTWDDVTQLSGSKDKIFEITSVTKLPRRVATFSPRCLDESVAYNNTGHGIYITINFMNYVDSDIKDAVTPKCKEWLKNNIMPIINKYNASLLLLGTGPKVSDVIVHDIGYF